MARTEGDTWDLASSVGATATGVAASRALASKQPNPLINDPFADALVKAVGLEHCNRMADGELASGDDPLFNEQRICEQIAVRTRFFDGFDPKNPTAWIAEGLLIYLPPDAQDRLFDNITALSAPGSRLATEHMDIQGSADEWTEMLNERSRRMGSNIDLADLFYSGERNAAGDYLASTGWDVTIRSTREAYAVNGFEFPDDELAALAGDSGYLSAILK
jgi:O-methyltransferase involved in polyketide biosynthesis